MAGPDPDDAVPGEQELLSGVAVTVLRLSSQVLSLAEDLARPVGLTAAWWQVLGAVLEEPLPVAGIARQMGLTRQSVQRVADLLTERGLAEYRDNPAHRRARLVAVTPAGVAAVRRIHPAHARAAHLLAERMGPADLAAALTAMRALSAALEEVAPD